MSNYDVQRLVLAQENAALRAEVERLKATRVHITTLRAEVERLTGLIDDTESYLRHWSTAEPDIPLRVDEMAESAERECLALRAKLAKAEDVYSLSTCLCPKCGCACDTCREIIAAIREEKP